MKNETAMEELFNALASMGLFSMNQSVIDTYLKKERDQIAEAVNDTIGRTAGELYYNYKYGKIETNA